MRLSQYFLPLLRENPSEAQIVSHRLMLRAGMIRQSSAGIYSWLPLGFRVLKRVEQIVREEQDRSGAQEILMPTIQPAELWRESGRYEDYGKEMLRIKDRHDREMLYGPTNEEQVTEIVGASIKSYRDLPKNLYHIQWKFRDEVRPRFGVMRGREFLMKDNYSFDLDPAGAKRSYNKMFVAYLRTFARMGLKAIPMRADTGPIGGDLSHEFIILADTRESAAVCDRKLLDTDTHDDAGIVWPVSVAPSRVALINLRAGDAKCRTFADDLYAKLRNAGIDVLYDDRDESPGAKFAAMDLIGLPDQLIVGPRGVTAG